MREVLKLSAWIQQNYDTCLLASLSLFPLALHVVSFELVSQVQLIYMAVISIALLYAKILRKRALRVPPTEKVWVLVASSAGAGSLLSFVWPALAFSVLCWVLPLTLWAILFERKHRYSIAHQRIQYRRTQQSRWRAGKRAVLSEWKERLRWIAGVQHDMRQPLHALGLLVGHPALEASASEGGAIKQVIRQMTSCQRWLHDLAENMLEATRLELGEQREKRIESISSQELCKSIESWMGQLAEAKGLVFKLQVEDVPIYTDARRLKRVIGNLVFNAVEHTQEGYVSFVYQRLGGVHQFTISDTGPGLSEDLLSANPVQNSSFGSDLPKSGIGLYVVKKLCQEMEWNLSMVNGEAGGTTFVLELADRLAYRQAVV
jgi:signal transduction histidine kinase